MKKKPPSSPSPKTYKVGYKRPPKENQFQSGQSGNPPGRKKGSKSIKAMIAELVSEPVEVKGADGKKKRLPRLQVILLLAANLALTQAKLSSTRGYDVHDVPVNMPTLSTSIIGLR